MHIMKQAVRTGLSFGTVSGVITTLGLIIGLNAGTHSQLAVLGGILTIAVADALSDALGIHVSEESNTRRSSRDVWEATFTTFGAKFAIALTFVVPVILLPLSTAVYISIAWGFVLVALLSFFIARTQERSVMPVVLEHLFITVLVVIATHLIGQFAGTLGYNGM